VARTTAELVGGVIGIEPGDDVNPFIDGANDLVTAHCTGSGYSDARLEFIERWLAAHLYDVMRPRTSQEGISGGTQEQYERVAVDLFLNNTKYGQMAMFFDSAGNLAAINNSLKVVKAALGAQGTAGTTWLGTELEAF
jgi:hypothetical protein